MNVNSIDNKIPSAFQNNAMEKIKKNELKAPENKEVNPKKDYFSDSYIAEIENSEPVDEGLYSLDKNADGEPQIYFNKPKEGDQPVIDKEDEEPIIMKCTIDTDHIDREIKQINQKKQKVEQEILKAKNQNDDEKIEKLKAELTNINAELGSKDSDAYKKQNAKVSYSKVSK